MGCTIRVTTSDCFYNRWKMARGRYWSRAGGSADTPKIIMAMYDNNCPGDGIVHSVRKGEYVSFVHPREGTWTVKNIISGAGWANIEVFEPGELSKPEPTPEPDPEPITTKPQIISNYSDKLGYTVGDIIKSECVVKNIGGAGTVYLTVGLGYIDSSDMIFLTGTPTTDQLFLNYQQLYTFKEDVKVNITDYYRQQGIGWAYLQQQMYLFFLVGHKENRNITWDTERHIKIYLDEPEGFTDPASLGESIIGDIPEIIEDALPAFGGLGGLGGVIDDLKPDTKDVVNWVIDKITPEPKEPEEPVDIMPFLYIGFAGLVSYLLIRSQ